MRILYDSKQLTYKSPFGTLTPGQVCILNIHIPRNVEATTVQCLINYDGGSRAKTVDMRKTAQKGAYEVFTGEFSLEHRGLYFYYFYIDTPTGGFRLFKQGDDTKMEAGDLWQVSCIPETFLTPDWAKGATYYQIFPDRFHKSFSSRHRCI